MADKKKPAEKKPEPVAVKEIVHKLTPTELTEVLADSRMAVHDKQEVVRAFVRGGFVNARYESAMVGHIADPNIPLA
jgi:hypothetical protein